MRHKNTHKIRNKCEILRKIGLGKKLGKSSKIRIAGQPEVSRAKPRGIMNSIKTSSTINSTPEQFYFTPLPGSP